MSLNGIALALLTTTTTNLRGLVCRWQQAQQTVAWWDCFQVADSSARLTAVGSRVACNCLCLCNAHHTSTLISHNWPSLSSVCEQSGLVPCTHHQWSWRHRLLSELHAGQNFQTRPDPRKPWPDPTRMPIHNGKSCKTNNELNVCSLLCAHTHECTSQFNTHRHAHVFTGCWSVQHACPNDDNWTLTHIKCRPSVPK